jgi:hypothetical protein
LSENHGNHATSISTNVVSIRPCLKVRPGKTDVFQADLSKLVEKTAREKDNPFYDVTISGDTVLCREAYIGAEGLLAHLANVGAVLGRQLNCLGTGPREELVFLDG